MPYSSNQDELVFLPLGGVGEIGMNLYLYGVGPSYHRHWLMVDLGITFPGEREPGIERILPDTRFIEEERGSLSGIVLTHAHEDHFGAVIDLWPRLKAPVYATPFTAALLRARLIEKGLENEIPLIEVPLKGRLDIGPFDVEFITMAHSIPEPNGLVIRTSVGTVFHTGDWKLDPHPVLGEPLDEKRIRQLGEEGVDVLVCDSTNALREGISPTEADVARTLKKIILGAEKRVAVTTFASNVARLRSVITAAHEADRHVVIAGRAMLRTLQVARETGYLPEGTELLSDDEYGYLPRDKVVALCTGSQGESRGALARIAGDSHPRITFSPGDQVIFSSRTIPGNEKGVSWIQNRLIDAGIDVITDDDALVHCSGHPRQGELEQLYGWVRPAAAIPMHGEARHLAAHARLALSFGVKTVAEARNGSLIRLSPAPVEQFDNAPSGRLLLDGNILVEDGNQAIRERRKLAVMGTVSVSLVLSKGGDILGEPVIAFHGIPEEDKDGDPMEEIILDSIFGALDGIPRPRKKNTDLAGESVRRAVRAGINQVWGKKPLCSVLVTVV